MMNDDARRDHSNSDDRWATDVDNLCQRFRNRWQSDHRFTVERFVRRLGSGSPPESILLPPLIEEEIRLRFAADMDLDYQDYEQRFPGYARVILSIFKELKPAEKVIGATAWQIGSGELYDIQSLDESNIPKTLDQYEVFEKVGEGAFGIVYRAMDHDRNLEVALKFPRSRVINSPDELDAFFEEAKNARSLEHEGIVKTFGLDGAEGYVFIVQKFVRGMSLAEWLKGEHSTRDFIRLIVGVANAAAFAHNRKIYHRDLKPSNIMVADDGTPLIADFGLAIHEDVQRRHEGRRCGSAAYMSPELAEGWAHLIDGRSDIWSIGVIIYKALTGAHPFRGDTRDEFLDDIKERPVKPPRMIEPEIDKELQRICLRCLNKPIRERYLTGDELARDLEEWLGKPSTSKPQEEIPVVPQGLRSFNADDAEFFLQLLPGPRDRHGMPDSIRFWKSKIEPEDRKPTIPVGVIFGPSGSGKSSFVKAGLLPSLNLNPDEKIYIEATSRDTEVRLIRKIRDQAGSITEEMSLPEAFDLLKSLRAGPKHRRTLVVIDQFEQWLHANIDYAKAQLASALRHCDGENLQCVLLVRDDFWVSISRFLNALEIDLREGENAWRVDRFPHAHARNVLIKFGRAFGQLSKDAGEVTPEQEAFLDQAIEGLSEESRVISVRLSIFAEMFKNRPWTRKELNRVGGISGIGETFLEEMFATENSPPQFKVHYDAAQAVLRALLPESGVHIRGHLCSRDELLEVSTYRNKPDRFDRLMESLDRDLRLVTPTNPDVADSKPDDNDARSKETHYQLTHDYLVPSIRSWLTREMAKHWQGRTQLRFNVLVEQWEQFQTDRYLPSYLGHWVMQFALPKQVKKTHPAFFKKSWRRSNRTSFSIVCIFSLLLVVSFVSFNLYFDSVAKGVSERYLNSSPDAADQILKNSTRLISRVPDYLEEKRINGSKREKLHSCIALLHLDPSNKQVLSELVSLIPTAELEECTYISRALKLTGQVALEFLTKVSTNNNSVDARFRYAVISLQLGDVSPVEQILRIQPDPSERIYLIHNLEHWHGDLADIAEILKKRSNEELRGGMCLALGNVDRRTIDDEEYAAVLELFLDVYERSNEGHGRSLAQWAIDQWTPTPNAIVAKTSGQAEHFGWQKINDNWRTADFAGDVFTFIRLKPGILRKGAGLPTDVLNTYSWLEQKPVNISSSFFICSVEVSQSLFHRFVISLPKEDPLRTRLSREPELLTSLAKNHRHPMSGVSFFDAIRFIDWLNEKFQFPHSPYHREGRVVTKNPKFKTGFRLPSSDEWEFACRANSSTTFSFGDASSYQMLSKYAWYGTGGDANILSVGKSGAKMPNSWGIYDMHGNALEWCEDSVDTTNHVVRGGGVKTTFNRLYSGYFSDLNPDSNSGSLGFRLVFQFGPN